MLLVALRKESVDRKMREDVSYNIKETSLSARRAWIEKRMRAGPTFRRMSLSARRAWIENHYDGTTSDTYPGSLSARRAWIENF